MADLVKALEADLFGSYEWAADQYLDLRVVPDAPERLLVHQGLLRALDALERADEAAAAAEGLVLAEDALDPDARGVVLPVAAAREEVLDAEDPREQARLAPAYLDAVDRARDGGQGDLLAADAILAALLRANLLASLRRDLASGPGGLHEKAPLLRRAAELYAAAGATYHARVLRGERVWQETARSCHHRAAIAWRATGDEERARALAESAEKMGGGGAAWYV